MHIEEICKRARAEGLTYGQYVYKHRAELLGKRPEYRDHDNYRICQNDKCGKEFVPNTCRQKFCSTRCRYNYNARKQRERKKAYD